MEARHLNGETINQVVKALPGLIGRKVLAPGTLSEDCSLTELLEDYFRFMQIAYCVRRAGVKAMVYRVETGKTKLSPTDYLDEAYNRLLAVYQEVYPVRKHTETSMLEELRGITEEEEQLVMRHLPELDAIMLEVIRQDSAAID